MKSYSKIEKLWFVAYFGHVVESLHELISQGLARELTCSNGYYVDAN